MKPVLVLYATGEGHTRRIAGYVAAAVRARGLPASLVSAANIPEGFSLDGHSAAILTASAHGGRHEREVTAFVKLHRSELERIPTAFLSVSLSEAGAENPTAPSERRAQATADVEKMIEVFLAETGWRPTYVKAVAGALLYTKYNFLLRFMMKRIARRAGGMWTRREIINTPTGKHWIASSMNLPGQGTSAVSRLTHLDTCSPRDRLLTAPYFRALK